MVISDAFPVRISRDVAEALSSGRAVVALESTVFSRLGLPAPRNAEALERCLRAVRNSGAIPAVCAVIDGVACVGLSDDEAALVLDADAKVAERDLPVAVGLGWPVGVTTVSATVALAAHVGIPVFATGGIGGVHHDAPITGDVSADLDALGRHPVVTVSAGAKAFLDLGRTLEELDTRGVTVVGWGTHELPAFWSRESGHQVPHRVDDAVAAARIGRVAQARGRGVLVTAPVPATAEIPRSEIEPVIAAVLADAERSGIRGGAVTPMILARIAESTGGRTVETNLALAEHNASVAGLIAVAMTSRAL